MTDWDRRFLELAAHISQWSKDPSTRVGAVIVGPQKEIRATGYNGFPRGILDDDRLEDRELKLQYAVHAEENAIVAAARVGVPILGCTIYTTLQPCPSCARSIIQAGISRVVSHREVPERWVEAMTLARRMFFEAGVAVTLIP